MIFGRRHSPENGFTLIELIITLVILGVLASVALPKFIDITTDAKVAALNNIASQIKSVTRLSQMKARIKGLKPSNANPGGSNQQEYVVDFGYGRSEVDWRNLCPESRAEVGDRFRLVDFLASDIEDTMETRVTNRHTLIGYDVPSSGTPTNQGCYLIYDSFGNPNCTIDVVSIDC